jgi:hypothetical protein
MKLLSLFSIIVYINMGKADEITIQPLLTEINLDCKILGNLWKQIPGIRVNDLSDLTTLPAQELKTIESLRKQVQPLGIIALADYSCARTEAPLNSATVKVFVFKNNNLALDWWNKKYTFENWQQHYSPVQNDSYLAVDSKQLKKRAVLSNNLWMTTHHIGQGNEHLLLLDNLIHKIMK